MEKLENIEGKWHLGHCKTTRITIELKSRLARVLQFFTAFNTLKDFFLMFSVWICKTIVWGMVLLLSHHENQKSNQINNDS